MKWANFRHGLKSMLLRVFLLGLTIGPVPNIWAGTFNDQYLKDVEAQLQASLARANTKQLKDAEAQLQSSLAQANAQIDPAQKAKLESAQNAWDAYRKLAIAYYYETTSRYDNSDYQDVVDFSALLIWFRVAHLNRMLEHRDLLGTDKDFRDADVALNDLYDALRQSSEHRNWRDILKEVELAWIAYRDAATESEASTCANPVSASIYIKTELTYERIGILKGYGERIARRVSGTPPDLEKELFLVKIFNEKPEVRQQAMDFFCTNAKDSLPLLIAQLRIGLLPETAAPIFEKAGPDAIPLLVNSMDRQIYGLPKILAAMGPTIVPELVQGISSDNVEVSRNSINALALLKADARDAIPALLAQVRDAKGVDPKLAWRRGVSAKAALQIAPQESEVVKTIVDAYIASPTNDESYADALRTIRHAAKDALPTLMQQARSEKQSSGSTNFPIASIVTPEDSGLVPSLIEGLVDPKNENWRSFSFALVRIGNSAVPQLITLLESSDPMKMRRAASTFAEMKQLPENAVASLISASRTEDTFAAVNFLNVLAKFPGSANAAIPALLDIYRSNRPGVSLAALEALHAIAPDLEEVKKLWPVAPYVLDPYYDAGCYADSYSNGPDRHFEIAADFNNDGIEDLAVSGPLGEFGQGGGPWSLYLRTIEQKFKKISDFAAPLHFDLFTKEKGVGYLETYWHISGSEGVTSVSKITMDQFTPVAGVYVESNAEGNVQTVDIDKEIPQLVGYTKIELNASPIKAESLSGK